MPSERAALRIAASFAGAFVIAEWADLQLTFIAPLVAGTLAAGAAAPLAALLVLPAVAWLAVLVAGVALQALHGMPLVLALVLFAIFRWAFRLCLRPATAPVGLVFLVLCAVIPDVLIRAPELAGDLARWCFGNFVAASVAVVLAQLALPRAAADRAADGPLVGPVPPGLAAALLLLATVLTGALQPPAPGAVLVSVVVALRPDRVAPARVIRDRLLAAAVGGAAAAIAWQAVWLAPGLAVFGTVTLLLAWIIARVIVAPGPWRGTAAKTLNAFAILVGQGFSVFYDDTDDRLWVRIVGVVLGVAYVALALVLLRRTRPRAAVAAAA